MPSLPTSVRAVVPGLVLAALLAGLLPGSPATGEEPAKMTGKAIREALTGNTVDGVWGERPYRSYFRPDGLTIYKPEGAPAENGKWRVDEDKDQYCSWWARTGWSCYNLYRDGRTIYWEIPGGDTRYRSELLGGKQF